MKGQFATAPSKIWGSNKWLISFEVDEEPAIFDKLKDKDLNIEIKQFREKRSLNANSYFHLMVDKIAAVLRSTHTEIHNWLISEYGQIDEQINNIILDDEIEWRKIETIHLRPTTATRVMDNGKLYRVYWVMRGSHTYDTAEMSRLIDGTVEQAKDIGIETMPPDEIERMKALWNPS